MNKTITSGSLVVLLIVLLLSSCEQNHFISDTEYLAKVENRFEERKALAENRSEQLFNIFKQDLSLEEQEALKFLYAYMPLGDLADYNGDFFLKLVRSSLDAKNTFNWGKKIPEDIFRHFVLPYRVNNENLDSARMVFFYELKDRIYNMNMKDAALEVNHWCHEKVNYQSTDIRTSAPLSTIKNSFGRCGEESTFTVTALRSVCIPARQVYTPRWAHCDDNHAWVEVWVDGNWHYLGACEPESDLDIGWFTEPARRAMLVHTKVFGDYTGDDEVVKKTENFTEINVIGNYADVKKIYVKVIDNKSSNCIDARIDFGLYNYAEFHPIASKQTDSEGMASLTTGYGDLLIWASKDGKYTFKKITVADADTLFLNIEASEKQNESLDLNVIPPIEPKPYEINKTKKEENNIRLKKEDEIRANYRKTFIDSASAFSLAEKHNYDKQETWKLLQTSQGNWKEIKAFLEIGNQENTKAIFALLNNISAKDLRDTKKEIISDHLNNTLNNLKVGNYDTTIYYKYVLNPRIKNENLVAFRGYLQNEFKDLLNASSEEKTQNIISWIKKNIQINEKDQYYDLPITPIGVYELKTANKESRDIFFVALCRSLGIPARLESATKAPQYFNGIKMINVYFEKLDQSQPNKGYLALIYLNEDTEVEPRYYINFTIAKLINGVYKTSEYDWEKPLSAFPEQIELETGYYRLITGNRQSDGSVLTKISHFTISKNEQTNIPLVIRDNPSLKTVYGKIDINAEMQNIKDSVKIFDLVRNKHLVMGWIKPETEPTKHILRDLKALKDDFEAWNGKIIFMVPDQNKAVINEALKTELPSNCFFPETTNQDLLESIKFTLGLNSDINFPLIVVINQEGEIVNYSQGYRTGTGEQLLKTIL